MRALPQDFKDEAGQDYNRPVELYQVFLDDITLYLAGYNKDLEFYNEKGQKETYYAIGISRTPIRTNVTTQIDQTDVSIDNVNLEMSGFIAQTEFRGRKMRILKVMLDSLDDPTHYALLFEGKMDEPTITESAMMVRVASQLDVLTTLAPRRKFQQFCNWKFGGAECGVNVASLTVSGTINSISQDRKTLTLSGRSEAAGHFNNGVITAGGVSFSIAKSAGAQITLDYAAPPEITTGISYQMRPGCDKTKDNCVKHNNFARFGGFLSVPTERVRPPR